MRSLLFQELLAMVRVSLRTASRALWYKRLRAARVDKAHCVRSADAGSFARDYSLALPACYARDVLRPSSYKARLLRKRMPLKSTSANRGRYAQLTSRKSLPSPSSPQSPHPPKHSPLLPTQQSPRIPPMPPRNNPHNPHNPPTHTSPNSPNTPKNSPQ